MISSNSLRSIHDQAYRIQYNGLHVDLVKTSQGLVRVGSMPDISKLMEFHGFREEIVAVPPWQGSMAGDNFTGEEFVLWQAQVRGAICRTYTGAPKDVETLYRNLDDTFSFFFDPERIRIVKKRWLRNWMARVPASPEFRKGKVRIRFEPDQVIVEDNGRCLYSKGCVDHPADPDSLVRSALERVAPDRTVRRHLEIRAMGTGNGFCGTVSSFILRHGKQTIWIDPCGYPAHALARYGVHWDDVTHILITHNHEDHIQGLSACLMRAQQTGRPLSLITAPSIFQILEKQFSPLCPEFKNMVHLIPLTPEAHLDLGDFRIESRWNHHFLPYGTLGLKFTAGGKSVGYSGDTKFDEKINAAVGREELSARWFADCDLVFHEVDFDNPRSVHTHWKSLQRLSASISGTVLAYHAPYLANSPLPLAVEGKTYTL